MPNRIIKESICTSCEIEALTPEQENTFYRIMVNVDDYGRMPANTKLLRSKLYPLRIDEIGDGKIEEWLKALAKPGTDGKGLVYLYHVDGQRYLQVTKWEDHQQIRAKRSKWPAPDQATAASNGYQPPADEPVNESNPDPNESGSNSSAKFGPDDPPILLAAELKRLILENNPKAKTPKDLQAWALTFDRAIRIDGRTPEELLSIIRFSQKDEFWQAVALSADTIRKKYDQLLMQAKRKKGRTEPQAWNTIREWLEKQEGAEQNG